MLGSEPIIAQIARLFTSRAGRNGLWAVAEYGAYPLFMLAATPFFLKWLGVQQYGRWMFVLVFTGFGGMTGLGMGTAATKEVSAALGRNDKSHALTTVRTCLTLTIVSSLAFSLLVLVIGLVFGESWFAKIGAWYEVWPLLIFAAILVFLEQIDQVFAGALRGAERFDLSARIEAMAKLVGVVAALGAAFASGSLWHVLAAVVAVTLLRMVAKAKVTSDLLSGPTYIPTWSTQGARQIFAFGKWAWLQGIGSSLFSTVDRLMVGSFLGASSLSHYSICIQLAQQVQTLPAAGAQVLFPAVSNRITAGKDFAGLIVRGSLLLIMICASLGLALSILAHPLLSRWINSDFANQNTALLQFLTLAYFILGLNIGPHFALFGLGKSNLAASVGIASGLISIIVMAVTLGPLGLFGASLGRLAYGIVALADFYFVWSALKQHGRRVTL